jgi:hypothetical protein
MKKEFGNSFPYYYLFRPAFAQGILFSMFGFRFSAERLIIVNKLRISLGAAYTELGMIVHQALHPT